MQCAALAAHGGGGGGGGGGRSAGGYSGGSRGSYGGARYSGGSYSGARYSGATSANYIHSGNANFAHSGQNANALHHGYNGNYWGHNNWDHYFNHGYWGPGWGWGWGWGYPFGLSLWWGYPYGGYYPDYFAPYGPYYASAYPASPYVYDYGPPADSGEYSVASPPQEPLAADALPQSGGEAAPNEGLQYYNEGRAAFQQGNYRDALRMAGHAGVESPQNPKVHELTSLALFASGDYRGAATEAHAALALGAPSSWADIYGYYNDNDKYTQQLRKLEKTVATVPNSAPGHFLLGYHYLMTGAKAEAKEHFSLAAKLTPNDKLAQHIVKQLDAGDAVAPPELPKPPVKGAAPTPPTPSPPETSQGQSL
jgi:hypothetical protein